MHARDVAIDYIVEAFSHNPHSSINYYKSSIQAPQQEIFNSFQADDPCYPTRPQITYDDLAEWWKRYYDQCIGSGTYDAVLLISDYSGGGGRTINNKYATIGVGQELLSIPKFSNSEYEIGSAYWGPWVVLHELGHALLDESWEHNAGDTFYDGGDYYRSPFASNQAQDGGTTNACGSWVDPWDNDHVAMKWDDCAYNAFQ